ncbi:hypothetical protein BJ684DRAFT_21791 [Piptocephalis cylindrospora]|uniref:Secreted protein n=1 Tax=Piptocephalis cylindrospora TaxID=1907219 RepID=A0A4P9XZ17_9FUNG|nr:hypothetical protein BJ684DRAFT_21791 [Piptocephalis cylindrospora]|eukprot:RKP11634.1 hypothetical protein BJ684DRAFT_21791 [Piptocephalis cylindrospora]
MHSIFLSVLTLTVVAITVFFVQPSASTPIPKGVARAAGYGAMGGFAAALVLAQSSEAAPWFGRNKDEADTNDKNDKQSKKAEKQLDKNRYKDLTPHQLSTNLSVANQPTVPTTKSTE